MIWVAEAGLYRPRLVVVISARQNSSFTDYAADEISNDAKPEIISFCLLVTQ